MRVGRAILLLPVALSCSGLSAPADAGDLRVAADAGIHRPRRASAPQPVPSQGRICDTTTPGVFGAPVPTSCHPVDGPRRNGTSPHATR